MTDTTVTQALTEQLTALRALARRLVRDDDLADDAVQDACVAALQRPVRDASLRGWFGRVVTNAARQRARSERRRRDREQVVASPAHDDRDPAELADQLALHRRLLRHVSELPEAQRAVVTLRFWRGCSTRELADVLGTSQRAVRDRLQTALAELRRRLDDESRGRAAWSAPLAAWCGLPADGAARPAPALLWLTTGVLAMPTKLLVTGGLLAAVVTAFVLFGRTPAPAAPDGRDTTTNDVIAHAAGGGAAPEPARTAAAAAHDEGRAQDAAVEAPELLRGFVADLDGRRVAGVRVVFAPTGGERDPDSAAVTGPDGAFALPMPDGLGAVTTDDPRWAAVRRHHLDQRGNVEDVVVLVAAACDYAGVVVDPEGAPVGNARVVIGLPNEGRTRLIDGKALALPHDLAATDTDAAGRFAFRRLGFVDGAELTARRSPFGGASLTLPNVSTPDLLVTMSAPPPLDAVHGVVLDARGAPVEGASVAAGAAAARTARDGTFRVVWRGDEPPAFVSAVAPGLGAATAALQVGGDAPGFRADNPVVLRMPAAPLRLTGRVVDADGEPVAGARVWTPDLTFFGQVARDAQGHEVWAESSVEEQFGDRDMRDVSTTSAADGTFVLDGVLARDYALFAIRPGDLAAAGPVTANPGAPVEVQLADAPRRRVAGRITTPAGAPLAGVTVTLARRLPWQRPTRTPDPWSGSPLAPPVASSGRIGPVVETDEDGAFALPECVVDGTSLRFGGDAVFMPRPRELDPAEDVAALVIELPARTAFRVHSSAADATAYSVVTDGDAHVPILVRTDGLLMSVPRVGFERGVAPVAMCEAKRVTLVLWRGDEELLRREVELAPGGVHDLQL